MRLLVTKCDAIVGPWVAARTGGQWWPGHTTLGLADGPKLIAGVLYEAFNGASITMSVAAEGRNWLDRRFLWAAFDYPFNQLGCKTVVGLVSSANKRAQRFDEHLGFKLVATLEQAHQEGDMLVYQMLRRDCRWLELGKRYGRQKLSTSIA